jgi:hypothetical protein
MTSYSFSVSGSWWLLLLCGVAAAALSWYVYRTTNPPVATVRRIGLFLLRMAALLILLFALFEPIVNMLRASEEPPRIAVALDASQSMTLQDASQNRSEVYRSLINALPWEALTGGSADTSVPVLLFDNDVRRKANVTPDSLPLSLFKGQLSNLSKPLRHIFEQAERTNTRAAVFITDGALNAGENPLYAAELLARPLYVIGVGDSTEPRDLKVQSILTNDIGYVGAVLPVTVNIQANGFSRDAVREAKLLLKDNGITIAEQRFVLNSIGNAGAAVSANTSHSVPITSIAFEYTPKESGIRKLTASLQNVKGFEGELTTKNNSNDVFVRILKNKRKVVLVAGAPNPDISFVRTALSENRTVECSAFIQGVNGEFLAPGSDGSSASASASASASSSANSSTAFSPQQPPTAASFTQALSDAESIILVGFPVASTPAATLEAVRAELSRNKPLLFVASHDVDYQKLRVLEPYLPFATLGTSRQEMLALPDVHATSLANPIMKLTGTEADARLWNNLPPLYRTETFFKVKPESEVLSTIRVNNVPVAEPLIVQRTLAGSKSLAILGYGLYRWKLLGFAAEQAKGRETTDIITTFLDNGLRWLSTSDQGKFVRIKSTREVYANGERVEIVGQVYDRSYTPIDNADVRIRLSGSASRTQDREIPLTSLGGGRYAAQIDALAQGDYVFSGTASLNGQPYGSDDGRFAVGELNIEYQNLRMNASLLRQMAARTGGKFYTAAEVIRNPQALLQDIRSAQTFKARPITERKEIPLWNRPWLLTAALALLAGEWFIRKRSGMV